MADILQTQFSTIFSGMTGILQALILLCIFWNDILQTLIHAFSGMYLDSKFTEGPIENKSALIQVMAWQRTGDKSSPETMKTYHQISNISRTKSQPLTVSCLVWQSSSPNQLKPGIKSRMKM